MNEENIHHQFNYISDSKIHKRNDSKMPPLDIPGFEKNNFKKLESIQLQDPNVSSIPSISIRHNLMMSIEPKTVLQDLEPNKRRKGTCFQKFFFRQHDHTFDLGQKKVLEQSDLNPLAKQNRIENVLKQWNIHYTKRVKYLKSLGPNYKYQYPFKYCLYRLILKY